MPRKIILRYDKRNKQWYKTINKKKYYFGAAKRKTDLEAYKRAETRYFALVGQNSIAVEETRYSENKALLSTYLSVKQVHIIRHKMYHRILSQFVEFVGNSKISSQHFLDFFSVYINKSLSTHTQQMHKNVLGCFAKYLNINVMLPTIKIPYKDIEVFEKYEVQKMYYMSSDEFRLILLLALNCGLLENDICNLTLDNVRDGYLSYTRSKTGISGKFKLWSETLEALEKIKLPTDKKNFTAKCRRDMLKTCKLAGVKYKPFKTLRKTGATYIREISNSLTVTQQYLAHVPISVCDKFYVKASIEKLDDALDALRDELKLSVKMLHLEA